MSARASPSRILSSLLAIRAPLLTAHHRRLHYTCPLLGRPPHPDRLLLYPPSFLQGTPRPICIADSSAAWMCTLVSCDRRSGSAVVVNLPVFRSHLS
ncbi:hypothetical protein PENSPDRAFT_612490 [Peniophora sp. CONT]|nr:hypothetical protein PENSPDRAFT_612490 [Peniophora sp. CONT]